MSYIAAAYNKALVEKVRKALKQYITNEDAKVEDILVNLLRDKEIKRFFGRSTKPGDDLLKVIGIVKAAHRIMWEELRKTEKLLKSGQKNVELNTDVVVFGADLLSAAYKLAKDGKMHIARLSDDDPRKHEISVALEKISEEFEILRDTFDSIGIERVSSFLDVGHIHTLNLRAMIGDRDAQKEIIKKAWDVIEYVGDGLLDKKECKWYLDQLELPPKIKNRFMRALRKIDNPYNIEMHAKERPKRHGSDLPYAI